MGLDKEKRDKYLKDYREKNREYINTRQREYVKNNKEKVYLKNKEYDEGHKQDRSNRERNRYLQNKKEYYFKNIYYKYGITKDIYYKMLDDQNYECAICGVSFISKDPCIDHNHITGGARGLLCSKCNLGIGHFEDSPDLLMRAAEYLEVYHFKDV